LGFSRLLAKLRRMSGDRKIHNLALVGFMGTGKSSVGRLAAELLRFEFVDTDELIEAQSGLSVEKIFKTQGEPAFRQLEKRVVQNLAQQKKIVIATGGGLISDPENLASLRTHAMIVCLWASPETIWERVRSQTHRPLLRTEDPLAKIHELFARRDPVYRQADALIQTNHRSPKEVVQQVLFQFQLARR
jgi:shikimate kinase